MISNLQATVLNSNSMRFVIFTVLSVIITASPVWSATRRPEADKGPTEVQLQVFVVDMDNVNDADQNFTVNVFYMARWRDPALAHTNATRVSMNLSDIWNPRLQFINQQKVWLTMPKVVTVTPEGEVTYRQRAWGTFSQPLKLRNFPFDKQTFNIKCAAVGYKQDEVKLVQGPETPSAIAESFSVADWEILDWHAGPFNYKTAPGEPCSAAFQFSINAAREPDYFITTTIIPLILIVMMSWAVFWIDPKQTGTQMSVAMTTMLTLIAFRFAVAASLPHISYLTRMDIFILLSTVLVFASLIEVVITSVMAIEGRLELARRLDRWSRRLFPIAFVVVILIAFVL